MWEQLLVICTLSLLVMSDRPKEERFTFTQQSGDGRGGAYVATKRTENGGAAFAAAYGSSNGSGSFPTPPSFPFNIPTGGLPGIPPVGFPGGFPPGFPGVPHYNGGERGGGQGSGFAFASSDGSGNSERHVEVVGGNENSGSDARRGGPNTLPSIIPLPFLLFFALFFL